MILKFTWKSNEWEESSKSTTSSPQQPLLDELSVVVGGLLQRPAGQRGVEAESRV